MNTSRSEIHRRRGARVPDRRAKPSRQKPAWPVKLAELPPVDLSPRGTNTLGNPWSGKPALTPDVSRETSAQDMLSTADVVRLTGLSYRRLDLWATAGHIGGGNPGNGGRRWFSSRDVAVISYALPLTAAGLATAEAIRVAGELVDTRRPVPLAGGLAWVYPVLTPSPNPEGGPRHGSR